MVADHHMDQSSEEDWEFEDRLCPDDNVGEKGNKPDTSSVDATSDKAEEEKHPLHIAAELGECKTVDELLTDRHVRVDVNVKVEGKCSEPGEHNKFKYEGWTALHFAALGRRKEVVQRLLKVNDVDPNVQGGTWSETPLHLAASLGWADIVEELLKNRENHPIQVDVNIVDKDGQTALHKAALERPDSYTVHESPDVSTREKCKTFLSMWFHLQTFLRDLMFKASGSLNADIATIFQSFAPNKEGGLHHHKKGVVDGYAKVVELLLKHSDTQLTIQDAQEGTALDIAVERKEGKVFELLRLKVTPEVTNYNEPYYKERQANVDAANAMLVGAALIASVTFAAWLQPPLGYTTDYQEQYANAFPAPPTSNPVYASLEHHPLMEWFWAFNSLSFFSAIGTVIAGAHSVLPFRKSTIKREVAKLRFNLLLTSTFMACSMVFVLFAFATAGIVVLPPARRFKDNIFSTVSVGGGLCTVLLIRLLWNIGHAALA